MAYTNVTSHHAYHFNNLMFENVVAFNEEHVRAHPQTCGFGGTL